jgi:hypothetical protein
MPFITVTHVSEHLLPMSPVYTLPQGGEGIKEGGEGIRAMLLNILTYD